MCGSICISNRQLTIFWGIFSLYFALAPFSSSCLAATNKKALTAIGYSREEWNSTISTKLVNRPIRIFESKKIPGLRLLQSERIKTPEQLGNMETRCKNELAQLEYAEKRPFCHHISKRSEGVIDQGIFYEPYKNGIKTIIFTYTGTLESYSNRQNAIRKFYSEVKVP